jgi:long-chain acyl-CoA synthetase
MNLADVISDHDVGQLALIEGDQFITYGDLRSRIAVMQQSLGERGVTIGSTVALASGNDPAFVASTIAILGLGGHVMPLNPASPTAELIRTLDVAKPQMLLVGHAGRPYLDDDDIATPMVDLVALDAESAAVQADQPMTVVDRHDDDVAFYMPTSGTSGVAKVAMLSHGNLSFIHEAMQTLEPVISSSDVRLGVLPFSHIFGLNVVLMNSLRAGASIVLQQRFDAGESLQLIREYGVTILSGAPPMWQRWAAAEGPDDSLATIRHAASGAAALPLGVFEMVRDRFGVEIKQGYGLTETSPIVTAGRGGVPARPSSVGQVLPGVEVALVDDQGTPVDIGDEGEIVVRSPGVFLGYLDDIATTESMLTEDGWLWTGDVGIFDEDGFLYLVDRIKDIVIVSGFNVYPAEVENALMLHPGVSGAIVTGTADEMTGETVVAHVTGTATHEELDAHIAKHLSRYKRPTAYHFLDELPIAPSGKAIRRALR